MANEQYHYKGDFTFKFFASNQKKLAKQFINSIFPSKIKKLIRGKKLEDFEPDLVAEGYRKLEHFISDLTPKALNKHLNNAKPGPRGEKALTIFYLILKKEINLISRYNYFDIEEELGQVIVRNIIKNGRESFINTLR